ncbi:MAG: HAMP domain-containing sensor histidine kinase [Schleiferiaceae bacterium]|jgi:signal transduction histidine kinase|nr:HAMP domain-containing histidine kinase [Flavobacteriales bacterium]MDG1006519.1 HAMP domain-containing sensor histidine kinase [Schleiferiaceae bacterium]MBT3678063.1 HAMP domain-containing histidine kinase [Flavobacteriales bacterium]MBT3739339.1 HAMP domain-containing histidine kinase [Flavobacteriales bacterium]MBT4528203.1 HAMP domain-containing histidine kinase [Flavobacteriales bacterium]
MTGKGNVKVGLMGLAVAIGVLTWMYTEQLASQLSKEEQRRVDLWAQAVEQVTQSDPGTDLTLATSILEMNQSIPLILTDDQDRVISTRNLAISDSTTSRQQARLEVMKAYADAIPLEVLPGVNQYIYQDESLHLKRLRLYPKLLLGIIFCYVALAYAAFSRARKAEQDRVWTGLARETAHQLGTPLSALYGWIELLEQKGYSAAAMSEIRKDVNRLQTVADRFSKIGAEDAREPGNIKDVIEGMTSYVAKRLPKSVKLDIQCENNLPDIAMQPVLLSWVLENIIRNGVDALEGESGEVKLACVRLGNHLVIDITDNGKGMSSSLRRRVFEPGFTTKTRGWGLGLSLAKRIVERSHGGKLSVIASSPSSGSTFRIELPLT